MQACYRELGRAPGSPLSEFAATNAEDELTYPGRFAVMIHIDLQVAQAFQGKTYFLPFNLPPNDLIPADGTNVDLRTTLTFVFDLLVRGAEGTLLTVGHEAAKPARKPATSVFDRLRSGVEDLSGDVENEIDHLMSQPYPIHLARELWKEVMSLRVPAIALTLTHFDAPHIGLGVLFTIFLVTSVEMVRLTYTSTINHMSLKRQFEQLAQIDPLTGLFNRSVLDTDWFRCADCRAGVVAVHAIDLDHFKSGR